METQIEQFRRALAVHSPSFGLELQRHHVDRLAEYYRLVLIWNPKLHLVAPCPAEEFAVRHILESLLLLKYLPASARVADVGPGAGLPIIPCLMVREDLHGVLIESSRRKAVFLREALRAVQPPGRAELVPSRFENIEAPDVDFVTCRALDKFSELLPELVAWAPAHAKLLLFAGDALRIQIDALLAPETVERIPQSEKRYLIVTSPNSQDPV